MESQFNYAIKSIQEIELTESSTVFEFLPIQVEFIDGFLSLGNQYTLDLWQLGSLKLEGKLVGHSAGVTGAANLLESSMIASCSVDKTVQLWDLQQRKQEYSCTQSLELPNKSVPMGPSFIDSNQMICGSTSSSTFIFDLEKLSISQTFEFSSGEIDNQFWCLETGYLKSSNRIFIAQGGNLHFGDLRSKQHRTIKDIHLGQPTKVLFRENENRKEDQIFICSSDGNVTHVLLKDEQIVEKSSFLAHQDTPTTHLQILKKGAQEHLITGSFDSGIQFWNLQGEKLLEFGEFAGPFIIYEDQQCMVVRDGIQTRKGYFVDFE